MLCAFDATIRQRFGAVLAGLRENIEAQAGAPWPDE